MHTSALGGRIFNIFLLTIHLFGLDLVAIMKTILEGRVAAMSQNVYRSRQKALLGTSALFDSIFCADQ